MAELNVSRKTIEQTLTNSLKDAKVKRFIIPEYQRPYNWDIDECDTLWEDIRNFHLENKRDYQAEYFLGSIVSCLQDDGINIIDGQQRITSFFLLLRAFYTKLERMAAEHKEDEEIVGLMQQIAPCLWDVNPMSKKVADTSNIHLKSLVATEKDSDVFISIMKDGKSVDRKSKYSQNYEYFCKKCDEYAELSPLDWKELCLCILSQCIVLPIECKDLDSALTIFSTLNNRGMPLSDSDIFKAQLYKMAESKDDFTQKWKEIATVLDSAGLSFDDIFRYYTHCIRASKGDKSKEIGLRKFYSDNKFENLKDPLIMDNLMELAEFWKKLLKYEDKYCTLKAKQMLHCLRFYPNEYWKYIISVFYFKHKKNLKENLPVFLSRLLSYLFVMFLDKPTVNTIKDPIFQACIDVYNLGMPNLTCSINDFENKMNNMASSKISKPMILLNAYLYDTNQQLVVNDFQIEHIFPQKWDNSYFTWTKEDADLHINMLGNKIPFERRLNIQASNGFFSKKRGEYKKSSINEVKSLAEYSDWTKENIENRNLEMVQRLKDFFSKNLNT